MTNMVSANTLASVAALIGDVARANILSALLGGRALTAGELAQAAGVSPQTASGHLARLVDGGLVSADKQGRHRYFRLASNEIADLLEQLSAVSAAGPRRYRPTGPKDEAMRVSRTCYDHMAGTIAVALTDALVEGGHVEIEGRSGIVTEKGSAYLQGFGIPLDRAGESRRVFCRACMDWSERRYHLGGWLGAAVLLRCEELHWVRPVKDSRALRLTRAGQAGFSEVFGLREEVLRIVT
ncbi:ArsR/SmtB family transcription factor [Martelella endophytica]|uniref:ArsR family transcriptional regulator n=1 Tax=Martelella endophytica TaxID=1486262 RepID=A0A0D5LRV1_MAREN|nr:helix-turn-helix domain-containing protein [Martelella endophytica]AJY46690.1 ArsR family transcriptional regulator [Martelella endophytica]